MNKAFHLAPAYEVAHAVAKHLDEKWCCRGNNEAKIVVCTDETRDAHRIDVQFQSSSVYKSFHVSFRRLSEIIPAVNLHMRERMALCEN